MAFHDNLFRQFPLIAAIGLTMLVVAACAVQLHQDQDDPPPPPQADAPDTLAPKLEACLTVTPEQTATFEYCRRVWAENRHRFFGPQKRAPSPRKQTNRESQPESSTAPNDQEQPSQRGSAPTAPKE